MNIKTISIFLLAVALVASAGLVQPAAAQAQNATSSATSSTTSTTNTNATSTNINVTQRPLITNIAARPTADGTGATITWITDMPATSQVRYGTTLTNQARTPLDSTLTTTHSVSLGGLTPSSNYRYVIISNSSGDVSNSNLTTTSLRQGFTTLSGNTNSTTNTANNSANNSSTTSVASSITSTSTSNGNINSMNIAGLDINSILSRIQQIQTEIQTLEQQIQMFLNQGGTINNGSGSGSGTATSTNSSGSTAGSMSTTISPTSTSLPAGGSVDFSGRGWGIEEPVTVTVNGSVVETAHADGGGNFSTGSLSVPMTAGSQTYTFHGMNSGQTVTTTVNTTDSNNNSASSTSTSTSNM